MLLACLNFVPSLKAESRTNVYSITTVNCPNPGQLCTNTYNVQVQTDSALSVRYRASAGHCSDLRMHIILDGQEAAISARLSPGAYSAWFDLGAVTPGLHLLQLRGEGFVGGCNNGDIISFAGQLETVTSTNTPPSLAISTAVELCFPSLTNKQYQIQWVAGAGNTNWTPLTPIFVGTGSNICTFDSTRSNQTRIYRVELLP